MVQWAPDRRDLLLRYCRRSVRLWGLAGVADEDFGLESLLSLGGLRAGLLVLTALGLVGDKRCLLAARPRIKAFAMVSLASFQEEVLN